MKKISELHFRVCDKGLFLPIARRLARQAGKVSYWTPSEKAFPLVRDCLGDGFDDIERVDCYLEDLASVDCFVFPDVGFSGIQEHLEQMGFPVWGARRADELEISRGKFLDALKKTQLPVPKHEKITGISALREFLSGKEDLWIKISKFRGDWETFHWRSTEEDENELDYYSSKFGPFREEIIFYVFYPIESKIEDGCDTWCIDGQFPNLIVHGMEAKDKAFIGAFQKFSDLPEELRIVNDEFGMILGHYRYRSFFSSEVRITDEGESYFIDPTCRAGSPPSQIMTEMIDNYAEVIWGGANGELIEPEPAAKFGVQAIVSLKGNREKWRSLKAEGELDRWLKCGNCLRNGDQLVFPPDPDGHDADVGWMVGIGDTLDDAISHLRENSKLLPDGACCDYAPLADLLREIKEAEGKGMEFTDQPIPEPASVIES